MKNKSASTSLFLIFWSISSLFAGPSKTLEFKDLLEVKNLTYVTELGVSYTGKMAHTAQGTLFLLASETGEWTSGPDADGNTVFQSANIFEWDSSTGSIVNAYHAKGLSEDSEIVLNDLVFNESTGVYYGLDQENLKLYAYEFEPDTEKTVIVEKTRMIEVIIESEKVEPEADVIENIEPVVNTESAVDTADIVEAEEVALEQTPASQEPAIDATEKTSETDTETDTIVKDESQETDHAVEVTANEEITATEEELMEESDPLVEEIVEVTPPEPKTEWVEETYKEEVIEIVHHKFGVALREYDLSALETVSITDLHYDTENDTLILLAQNEEGNTVILSIQLTDDGILIPTDIIDTGSNKTGEVIAVDPFSKHWVIITDGVMSVYAKDGRLLRQESNETLAGISDICRVPVVAESEGLADAKLMVLKNGQIGTFIWDRAGEDIIHHVPGEFVTIQAAVDSAGNDDWVVLSPGVYEENVIISGKSINLVSYFQITEDLYFTANTVIQPDSDAAVRLEDLPGSSLYISGLHITGAEQGIVSSGNITIENLEVVGNGMGLVFSGGTAIISDSDIVENSGAGVTYSSATATLLERCRIGENGSDGIEIVITPYDGVLYRTVIRRNDIFDNAGSGLRFADAPISTQREFRIENNFIIGNQKAGVEVYLPQPDPKNLLPTGPRTRSSVYLVNNTIVQNPVGVLCGGNYRLINNIIAEAETAGIKDLKYHSVVIRNIFWENSENSSESNFNAGNNREEDPMFVGDDYILSVRSPAKRAGIPGNLWNDTSDRSGADIGASK